MAKFELPDELRTRFLSVGEPPSPDPPTWRELARRGPVVGGLPPLRRRTVLRWWLRGLRQGVRVRFVLSGPLMYFTTLVWAAAGAMAGWWALPISVVTVTVMIALTLRWPAPPRGN